jgi:hypothetical protein
MIYCPKCGTANRDGSRFCNECGEELGTQTHVKCPHCGTLNPVQNWFCNECRGRLLPSLASTPGAEAAPTIKGLSLPTKTPQDEQDTSEATDSMPESDDEIPAWLRELGASLSEGDELVEADSLEDASEIPDWLRDLRDSLPGESDSAMDRPEREEMPDWLSEPQVPAEVEPAPPTFSVEEEEILDRTAEPQPPHKEPEPTSPLSEAKEEEMPAWLAQLRSSNATEEAESTPPASEAEEEEAPDWLAQLRSSAVEKESRPTATEAEPEPTPPAPEPEEEPVPDWLAQLRSETAEAEPEPTPPAPEPEEEPVSDWLAQLRSEAAEAEPEPTPPAPAPEEESAPDWLPEVRPAATEAKAEPTRLAREPQEESVPDWLAELEPETAEAEPEPTPLAPEPEEEELADWLAELRPEVEEADLKPEEITDELTVFQATVIEAEPEPAPQAPATEEEEIPDWLAELEIAPDEERPTTEAPATEEMPTTPEGPDWLAELQMDLRETQPPSEETPTEGEAPDWLVPSEPDWEEEEGLAPAEIPAWLLALKPAELREEEEAEEPIAVFEEPKEETGLLAGLQGTLPVEMIIAQPRAVTTAETIELPVTDTPQARLFAEVVSRPPETAPKEILSAPSRDLTPLSRWIIYIVLIAVVSLPLLLGKPLLSHTPEPTKPAIDLHDAIESLDNNAPVLVAFDYDPAASGEMDVLAQALVGHLMDQGARVIAVSLLPAGPATAQSALDKLATDRADYADSYGQRYVNLGYLPGQATAIRLLGLSLETALPRDFQGTPLVDLPVMQDLNNTQDFDLIVELAATQDTLRSWIEQASTPYDIPLGAGVSASVDPWARPYYQTESQQLVGMIGGVPGAATYETLRSGQGRPTDMTAARLDSQLAGALVLILVLLIGNAVYLAQRGTGRKG